MEKPNGGEAMVKLFGIRIGEKEELQDPKQCKHPVMSRKMKYSPEKNAMEMVCQKCGQVVEE